MSITTKIFRQPEIRIFLSQLHGGSCKRMRNPLALATVLLALVIFPPGVRAITLGEALDNTNLVWTTGGSNNLGWTAQLNSGAFDGIDQAVSGGITHNQATWVQTS